MQTLNNFYSRSTLLLSQSHAKDPDHYAKSVCFFNGSYGVLGVVVAVCVCVCVCVCVTILMCFYCLQFHDFLEVFRICYRFDKQALNLHSEAERTTRD